MIVLLWVVIFVVNSIPCSCYCSAWLPKVCGLYKSTWSCRDLICPCFWSSFRSLRCSCSPSVFFLSPFWIRPILIDSTTLPYPLSIFVRSPSTLSSPTIVVEYEQWTWCCRSSPSHAWNVNLHSSIPCHSLGSSNSSPSAGFNSWNPALDSNIHTFCVGLGWTSHLWWRLSLLCTSLLPVGLIVLLVIGAHLTYFILIIPILSILSDLVYPSQSWIYPPQNPL